MEKENKSVRMLGAYLIEQGFITAEQLELAIQAQKTDEYRDLRVGDILRKQGIINREQLDKAIEQQMVDMHE